MPYLRSSSRALRTAGRISPMTYFLRIVIDVRFVSSPASQMAHLTLRAPGDDSTREALCHCRVLPSHKTQSHQAVRCKRRPGATATQYARSADRLSMSLLSTSDNRVTSRCSTMSWVILVRFPCCHGNYASNPWCHPPTSHAELKPWIHASHNGIETEN